MSRRDRGLLYVDYRTALCMAGREAVKDAKQGYWVPEIYGPGGVKLSLSCDRSDERGEPDVYHIGLPWDKAMARQTRAAVRACETRRRRRR